jgi:hypothetical protein
MTKEIVDELIKDFISKLQLEFPNYEFGEGSFDFRNARGIEMELKFGVGVSIAYEKTETEDAYIEYNYEEVKEMLLSAVISQLETTIEKINRKRR